MSYGLRWFDVIGNENVLAEIGFIDEDLVIGCQIERSYLSTTGYLGLLANAASSETEAFWGLRYDFRHGSQIRLETDFNLLSGSARSLGYLRRSALPDLWRANVGVR